MLVLVIGQSGSGKSAFAENLVMEWGEYKRVYVATMQIFDEESQKRVERHRKMRSAKNFQTVECPTHLERIVADFEDSIYRMAEEKAFKSSFVIDKNTVVLLECMSNLVANEIYSPDGRPNEVVDIICSAVKKISAQAKNMLVVTNDVFADGHKYDESTEAYMKKLGEINCRLGAVADEVYEVVSGCAVRIK